MALLPHALKMAAELKSSVCETGGEKEERKGGRKERTEKKERYVKGKDRIYMRRTNTFPNSLAHFL